MTVMEELKAYYHVHILIDKSNSIHPKQTVET